MPPIDRLIADFDGTVSEVDTLGLLVRTAVEHRTIAGEADSQESFLEWRETVEWYSEQCARIVDEWLACNRDEMEHVQNISKLPSDLVGLRGFLDAFEVLEYSSTRRVIESKFLSGLTRETLRALGRSVQMRPGVFEVIAAMRRHSLKERWKGCAIRLRPIVWCSMNQGVQLGKLIFALFLRKIS